MVDAKEGVEQRPRIPPVSPRLPSLAVAAVVLIAGLAVLFGQDLRFVNRSSPEAAAEYFMESWVAGDGEAAASMFGALGRFNSSVPGMLPKGLEAEELPALHDWYRATGWEWESRGCGPLRYTFFSCAFRYENKLTRAVGAEPVTGSFLLTIDEDGIDTVTNELGYYPGWDMFLDWTWMRHPDDIGKMYDTSRISPVFDQVSLSLWEQHTDEFFDEFAGVTDVLTEWKAQDSASPDPVVAWWLPEDYAAAVARICSAKSAEFEAAVAELTWTDDWTAEYEASWAETAARYSEEALADLSALPAPDIDTLRLAEVFALMEEQTHLLQQIAAAASAGDAAFAQELSRQRVELTHRKDQSGGPGFWACPVGLPA